MKEDKKAFVTHTKNAIPSRLIQFPWESKEDMAKRLAWEYTRSLFEKESISHPESNIQIPSREIQFLWETNEQYSLRIQWESKRVIVECEANGCFLRPCKN
jgi:hypothetical protein